MEAFEMMIVLVQTLLKMRTDIIASLNVLSQVFKLMIIRFKEPLIS